VTNAGRDALDLWDSEICDAPKDGNVMNAGARAARDGRVIIEFGDCH
jgi:hypothetical protein